MFSIVLNIFTMINVFCKMLIFLLLGLLIIIFPTYYISGAKYLVEQ